MNYRPLPCLEIMITMSGLEPGSVIMHHSVILQRVLPPPASTNCHQCRTEQPASLMLLWYLTVMLKGKLLLLKVVPSLTELCFWFICRCRGIQSMWSLFIWIWTLTLNWKVNARCDACDVDNCID